MKNLILGFFIGLLIFSGSQASDQASRNTLWSILTRLKHRAVIRFQTPDSSLHDGEFEKVQGKQLFYLTTLGEKKIPLDSIDVLWVRERATHKGAKKGLLYGAIAGAVSFHLLGWWAYGFSEGSDRGDPFLHAMGFSLVGSILVGGSGALIGAIIGSGTYVWEKKFERYPPPPKQAEKKPPTPVGVSPGKKPAPPAGEKKPSPPAAPAKQPETPPARKTVQSTVPAQLPHHFIASMGARMGLGVGMDPETSGGSAIGLIFQTNVNPLMSVVLEGNYFLLGETHESFEDDGRLITVDYSNHVIYLGGLMRVFLLRHGFRPCFSGGLGFYSWRDNYLGFNIGFGLNTPVYSEKYSFLFQARFHKNLQRVGGTTPTFVTGTVEVHYNW